MAKIGLGRQGTVALRKFLCAYEVRIVPMVTYESKVMLVLW